MAHPYQKHREHAVAHARVKVIMKADGGEIDAGESFPGGIKSTMHDLRDDQDRKEVAVGTRFSDNGSRIPGRQKARNDTYTDSLKKR